MNPMNYLRAHKLETVLGIGTAVSGGALWYAIAAGQLLESAVLTGDLLIYAMVYATMRDRKKAAQQTFAIMARHELAHVAQTMPKLEGRLAGE